MKDIKEKILQALKELREKSKKRNFEQTVDLIINLKNFDPKKENVKVFVELPYWTGKVNKVVLVAEEITPEIEKLVDDVVTKQAIEKADKKSFKKIVQQNDYFIALAKLVPLLAKNFGKLLGPKGKMPDPSLGCILPTLDKSKIEETVKRLRKTIRIKNSGLSIKCKVGKEKMKDDEIAENCLAVYDAIIKKLPKGEQNIKNMLIKLTMSKPVKVMAK